jgi:hypothetical protein
MHRVNGRQRRDVRLFRRSDDDKQSGRYGPSHQSSKHWTETEQSVQTESTAREDLRSDKWKIEMVVPQKDKCDQRTVKEGFQSGDLKKEETGIAQNRQGQVKH